MNVKPGDLAIVIHVAPMWTPEIVGKIVKVERLYVNGETINGNRCEESDLLSWICYSENGIPNRLSSGKFEIVKRRLIADECLRPVSGLTDEQHTEEHNEEEA